MNVGVQGSGAVGTGTIPENVLLVSLLSVTRLVESRVTVTGFPAPTKNTAAPALAGNPLTVCVTPVPLAEQDPLTVLAGDSLRGAIDIDHKASSSRLTNVIEEDPYTQRIARGQATNDL